jgi:hypothetical protein
MMKKELYSMIDHCMIGHHMLLTLLDTLLQD